MKRFTFSLPQPSRQFEVEAKTEDEAKKILEEADDLTDYEIDDNELWQPNLELQKEEKI